MLQRLADRLRGRYERLDEQDIERAIGIILEETDPRLRLVRGYRRKLRKPVIRSLVYVGQLVTRIPGPFAISRSTYGSDPQVNALFGSADDIDDLFARLLTFPNVLITAHQAFLTHEALAAIAETTLANVAAVASGESCPNEVVPAGT